MPGHWYLICPSILAARGELHHPAGGWEICEVPRAKAESCGANYIAMHIESSSALNWVYSWSEPSTVSACLRLRFVTQPTNKTKNTHSLPQIILDVDDFQKIHTRFIFQRTWILKYQKPDGNSLGATRYLYLSTLWHSFHENGTVILVIKW
jgi:hypothetical protein